jgi:hypothetical protein
VGHGFTGCGKIPKVSFRGRGLPEESAFFLGLVKKQIPRFARDDIKLLFSAASSAVTLTVLLGSALAADVLYDPRHLATMHSDLPAAKAFLTSRVTARLKPRPTRILGLSRSSFSPEPLPN